MSTASDLERQMLVLINNERAKYGLDPVKLELRLNDAAEDHSAWMLNVDTFSHTGVNGSSPGDRMRAADFEFSGNWSWAENIAWQSERGAPGLSDDVVDLHNGLMNSPGHRANILSQNVDLIGIGIETGNYNGWDAVMVTQKFARTSAPVELDTGASQPDPQPDPTPPTVPMASAGPDNIVLPQGFTDAFRAYSGNDTITGSTGVDIVFGNNGNDMLRGLDGNDALHGGEGRDTLLGGAGNDSLTGGGQNDAMAGGNGADRLFGQLGADWMDGGAGNDSLYGGAGYDKLMGGSGQDDLFGGTGNDQLNGGSGNDVLRGHLGNDILGGNTGRDVMFGGHGDDLFVFNAINHSGNTVGTADVIEDFQSGADRIYLKMIDASTSLPGNNAFSFRENGWFDTGAQGEIVVQQRDNAGTDNDFTMVYFDTDQDTGAEMALRLTGLHSLTADDFVL